MLRLSRMANIQHSLAVLVLTLLTACGGGGSSTTNPNPSNNNPSAQVASYTLGGLVNGLTGSGLILSNGSQTVNIDSGASNFAFATAIASGQDYSVSIQTQPLGQTCSISNSTGKILNTNITDVTVTCATNAHALGGTITGLTDDGLVLSNGSDTATVTGNSQSFVFPQTVAEGGDFAVKISHQPYNQTCQLNESSTKGIMGVADATNLSVTCKPAIFHTISGTYSGIPSGLFLIVQYTSDTAIHNFSTIPTYLEAYTTSAGNFIMKMPIAEGEKYSIAILDLDRYGLACQIQNGTGVMGNSDINNVQITCSGERYSLSGTINGLTTDGLILALGNDKISLAANQNTFLFDKKLVKNSTPYLRVEQQPTGQNCSIQNYPLFNSGDISNINVVCVEAHTIYGSITGLTTNGLSLTGDFWDPNYKIDPSKGTTKVNFGKVVVGNTYTLHVSALPRDIDCQITNGASGTMGTTDIENLTIECRGAIQQSTSIVEITPHTTEPGSGYTLSHQWYWTINKPITVTLLSDGRIDTYYQSNNQPVHNSFSSNITNFTEGSIIGLSGITATGQLAKIFTSSYQISATPNNIVKAYQSDDHPEDFLFLNQSGIAFANYGTCTFDAPQNCLNNITNIAVALDATYLSTINVPSQTGSSTTFPSVYKTFYAITNLGEVYGWGNGEGMLGEGKLNNNNYVMESNRNSPQKIPGLTNIKYITHQSETLSNLPYYVGGFVSNSYLFALKTNGTVVTWSTRKKHISLENYYPEIGPNFILTDTDEAKNLIPHLITGLGNVKEINGVHALLQDGSVIPDMRDLNKTVIGLPPIKHLSNGYLIDFTGRVFLMPYDSATQSYYIAEVTHP